MGLVSGGGVFVNRWRNGVARGCRVKGKWHENTGLFLLFLRPSACNRQHIRLSHFATIGLCKHVCVYANALLYLPEPLQDPVFLKIYNSCRHGNHCVSILMISLCAHVCECDKKGHRSCKQFCWSGIWALH